MNTFNLTRRDPVELFGEYFAQEIANEVINLRGSYVAVRAEFINGDEESPMFYGVFEAPEDFLKGGGGYVWSYQLADDWLG